MESTALIPDVHGDPQWFAQALRRAGADPCTGQILEGRWIVQLGDLVHVGPDSGACIMQASRMLEHPRYLQLLGNHDAAHLGGPWRSPHLAQVHRSAPWGAHLRRWWNQGRLHVAVAVAGAGRPVIVSHAGLSAGLWQKLGQPTAPVAACLLNWRRGAPASALAAATHEFAGGLLSGRKPTPYAGPLHAAVCAELLESWRHAPVGPDFDQIHAHASAWHWGAGRWEEGAAEWIRRGARRDAERRTCTIDVAGHEICALDPHRSAPPAPLILPGRPLQ